MSMQGTHQKNALFFWLAIVSTTKTKTVGPLTKEERENHILFQVYMEYEQELFIC